MPTQPYQAEPCVTLKEAARRLGVSPFTLRAWARYHRRLPFFKLGHRLMFAPSDLDEFLRASRVPAREEAKQSGA